LATFESQQNSFDPAERTIVNSHCLSNLEKCRGARRESRLHGGPYGGNFILIDRQKVFASAYNLHDPWNGKNRQPIQCVELAKHVSREKWKLDFLKTVRPSVPFPVERQERLQAPHTKMPRNHIFMPASDLHRVPLKAILLTHHLSPIASEQPLELH